MRSKSVSGIFKILFQTEDTNIFVFRGIFFSRYVQLKAPFMTKKTLAVKSETRFSREAIENSAEVGALQSYSCIAQSYTQNANRDVLLSVENV